MLPSDLLEFIRKRPFAPFRIFLSDGSTYDIRHPEMVMPGLASAIIGLPADPLQPIFSRWETIALNHVVRMAPINAAPVSNNGSATSS